MASISNSITVKLQKQFTQEDIETAMRRVFAEMFGEENVDQVLAEKSIDLSEFNWRPIRECKRDGETGRLLGETNAVIAIPDCKFDDIYFKLGHDRYEEMVHKIAGVQLARVEARDIVRKNDASLILRTEAMYYLDDYLKSAATIAEQLIGKRAAGKWLKDQRAFFGGSKNENKRAS